MNIITQPILLKLPPMYYEEYKDMSSVEVANLVQSRIQTKMDELIKEHA